MRAEAKGGATQTVGFNPAAAVPVDVFRVHPRQGRTRPDFVDGRNPATAPFPQAAEPGEGGTDAKSQRREPLAQAIPKYLSMA